MLAFIYIAVRPCRTCRYEQRCVDYQPAARLFSLCMLLPSFLHFSLLFFAFLSVFCLCLVCHDVVAGLLASRLMFVGVLVLVLCVAGWLVA